MGHLNGCDIDVLIVGAGPTGLAMAAEASRFNLRYRIIDKSPHGARFSQAVLVQTRTLEQFERYGIAEQAVALGRRLRRIRFYSEGQRVLESSFDDLPGPYPFVLFLPQPQTERLLTEYIERQSGAIERDVALEYFEARDEVVECVILGKSGARDTVTAAYVIGADGAQSTVRELLGTPVETYGPKFEILVGDLRLDGDMPEDELSVYLHSGTLLFLGRIDDTHCRVIVARDTQPLLRQPYVDDFQSAVDDAGIENLRVSDPVWMINLSVAEQQSAAYSRGRVFLAGDAGNVYAPLGGQGMNSGIQDAANVMWKIACVTRGRGGRLLLDSYDRERKPPSETMMRERNIALRAATASNWLLARLRDAILARIGSDDALQQRIHEAVTEIGVHYRHSAIVCECGSTSLLQAGDRAIDCSAVDHRGRQIHLFELFIKPLHTALAVFPPDGLDLQRFHEIVARHGEILQGVVIVDGDSELRKQYAAPGGTLYVVRPDGYIGFRGSLENIDALDAWLTGLFASS